MIRYQISNRPIFDDGCQQVFVNTKYHGDYFGTSVTASEDLVMSMIKNRLKDDGVRLDDADVRSTATYDDDIWRLLMDPATVRTYDECGFKVMHIYDVYWTVKRSPGHPETVGQKRSMHVLIIRERR